MTVPASFGMLLIRCMVGAVMVFHGAQKLFGWFDGKGMQAHIDFVGGLPIPGNIPADVLAYMSAGAEFGGGILLIIGLLTRVAALAVAINMGVAAFMVHGKAFSLAEGGMEYALTLGVVALGIMFTGAGKFSPDYLFRRRRAETLPPRADRKR